MCRIESANLARGGPSLGPGCAQKGRTWPKLRLRVQVMFNMGQLGTWDPFSKCGPTWRTLRNDMSSAPKTWETLVIRSVFRISDPILKACRPQLGPKLLPNVAACWTQVGAKLGPSWGQIGPKLGPCWPIMTPG